MKERTDKIYSPSTYGPSDSWELSDFSVKRLRDRCSPLRNPEAALTNEVGHYLLDTDERIEKNLRGKEETVVEIIGSCISGRESLLRAYEGSLKLEEHLRENPLPEGVKPDTIIDLTPGDNFSVNLMKAVLDVVTSNYVPNKDELDLDYDLIHPETLSFCDPKTRDVTVNTANLIYSRNGKKFEVRFSTEDWIERLYSEVNGNKSKFALGLATAYASAQRDLCKNERYKSIAIFENGEPAFYGNIIDHYLSQSGLENIKEKVNKIGWIDFDSASKIYGLLDKEFRVTLKKICKL